jgi:hypothetical protein
MISANCAGKLSYEWRVLFLLSLERLHRHRLATNGAKCPALAEDALALRAVPRFGRFFAEIGQAVFQVEFGDFAD